MEKNWNHHSKCPPAVLPAPFSQGRCCCSHFSPCFHRITLLTIRCLAYRTNLSLTLTDYILISCFPACCHCPLSQLRNCCIFRCFCITLSDFLSIIIISSWVKLRASLATTKLQATKILQKYYMLKTKRCLLHQHGLSVPQPFVFPHLLKKTNQQNIQVDSKMYLSLSQLFGAGAALRMETAASAWSSWGTTVSIPLHTTADGSFHTLSPQQVTQGDLQEQLIPLKWDTGKNERQ